MGENVHEAVERQGNRNTPLVPVRPRYHKHLGQDINGIVMLQAADRVAASPLITAACASSEHWTESTVVVEGSFGHASASTM